MDTVNVCEYMLGKNESEVNVFENTIMHNKEIICTQTFRCNRTKH